MSPSRSSPSAKVAGGNSKKKIRGAFAGTCIDLAAVPLHVGHQVLPSGKALGAEEEQMFEQVRQSRPGQGRVMAASRDSQYCSAALEAWDVTQCHLQAVGQGFSVGAEGVGGRHERFQNKDALMLAD